MKLEEQVVSLELAKKLKNLGVKQESVFFWVVTHDGWEVLNHTLMRHPGSLGTLYNVNIPETGHTYAALTVAELGEVLPAIGAHGWITTVRWKSYWKCSFVISNGNDKHTSLGDTEADARAKMLIYLIENNLLSANKPSDVPVSKET